MLLGVGVTTSANAAYTFNILDTPGGSYSTARGINNAGQVVGNSSLTSGYATLWDGATTTGFSTLGGYGSAALAINDTGQVVGSSYPLPRWNDPYTDEPRAALWNGGTVTDLGGSLGGITSYAHAINNTGQIAGWSYIANNSIQAILWNGGTATVLGTLGGSESKAWGINDAGQVAGWSYVNHTAIHATVWDGTTITDLGTLGGSWSGAAAINNAGQVAGYSQTTGDAGVHATLWNGGTITDLGTLGGAYSYANAINNAGQVVGYSYTSGWDLRAILWNGTAATDLNSFLDAGAISAGWVLTYARDINDNGWIVGDAYNRFTGQTHGFLLSDTAPPVPEPESYAMLLAGLGLLGFAGRRRENNAVRLALQKI
jgi:probable HAF family extracellular repeat protein